MNDNLQLELSMGPAAHGDEAQVRLFYASFLKGPLYVPERFQPQPLAGLARYPDDFLNILALEDAERVIVPVFSHAGYATEWCGQELTQRTLNGIDLINLLLPTWWVCVNPGSEYEKELTPWELDILRGGEQSLDALVHELLSDDYREPMQVRSLADGEHTELLQALRAEAQNQACVSKLYLLHETGKDLDDNPVETLLIGLACGDLEATQALEDIQHSFQNIADLHLIGSLRSRVFVGLDEADSIGLSVFRAFPPIFARDVKEPLVQKLLRFPLGRWLKGGTPK